MGRNKKTILEMKKGHLNEMVKLTGEVSDTPRVDFEFSRPVTERGPGSA